MDKNSHLIEDQPTGDPVPLGIEISAESGSKTVSINFSAPVKNLNFDVVQAANLSAVFAKAVATLLEPAQVIAPDSRLTDAGGKPL